MALAANSLSYFPPRHIQQMEEDLALLPLWWAEEGDCVLTPANVVYRVEADGTLSLQEDTSVLARLCADAEGSSPFNIWGWSLALRHRLLHLGIPESYLPSKELISEYRNLSSRAFAAEYIHQLFDDAGREGWSSRLVGRGMKVLNCFTELGKADTSFIFKTLWSSSGRGVFVYTPDTPFNADRVTSAIRNQGGILVDDFYEDKLLDFALEFETTDAGTHFLGYSVFEASTSGSYGGNIVAAQSRLRERILSTGIGAELLDKVIDYTTRTLGSLLADSYRGVFGVDMLICRHEGGIALHPCIEINLRRNMGILAIDVYQRLGDNATAILAGNPSHGFCAQVSDGKLFIGLGKR